MSYSFSYSNPVTYGWEEMKNHFRLFFCVLLLILLIQQVPNAIGRILQEERDSALQLMGFILTLSTGIIGLLLHLGTIRISLNIFDQDHAEVKDLFAGTSRFWRALGGAILYTFIVFIGLLLLIVPGIIWAIKYQFFYYLIVDKNCSIGEAFAQSAIITHGYKVNLFIFGFVLGLVNLLGVLCLFVGLFATIPTSWLATTRVYRELMQNQELKLQPATAK